MVNFQMGGWMNHQEIKAAIGMGGGVNPIASSTTRIEELKSGFRIRELQQYMRRYKWLNLPYGMDETIMERILYFRGRLVAFKIDDKFYTLPFALNGSIDIYGRYNSVMPLTFNGTIKTDKNDNEYEDDGVFIADYVLKVAYDELEVGGKDCVILNDYTQGISQNIIPRANLSGVYTELMGEIVTLIRHNLISSARIYTLRVLSEGEKNGVLSELNEMESQILKNGKRVFPITSAVDLKEVLNDKSLETQNYWECFVSVDNLRENEIGIENNGVFKKKERVLKGEQELEAGSADLVYSDGLENRRRFCEVFNAMFGTDVWVEESEVVKGEQIDNELTEEVVE